MNRTLKDPEAFPCLGQILYILYILIEAQIAHRTFHIFLYIKSSKNIYGNNYNHLTSPIEWHGDNGFISNCLLQDNVGDFGGAIYWTGNNGKIEKCVFDENAALFGGAVYIAGNMNDLVDCIFNASYATNHYEAIYLKNIDNPILH